MDENIITTETSSAQEKNLHPRGGIAEQHLPQTQKYTKPNGRGLFSNLSQQ
jgi:hypothetical protein